jgi:hypothetical protein
LVSQWCLVTCIRDFGPRSDLGDSSKMDWRLLRRPIGLCLRICRIPYRIRLRCVPRRPISENRSIRKCGLSGPPLRRTPINVEIKGQIKRFTTDFHNHPTATAPVKPAIVLSKADNSAGHQNPPPELPRRSYWASVKVWIPPVARFWTCQSSHPCPSSRRQSAWRLAHCE